MVLLLTELTVSSNRLEVHANSQGQPFSKKNINTLTNNSYVMGIEGMHVMSR